MTIADQFETAKLARELWLALMPADTIPPDLRQFIRWVSMFGDTTLCYAINRVARKRTHKADMSAEDCARYVTAVCSRQKQSRTAVRVTDRQRALI